MRWLLALLLVSGTAHAQAFKPRGKPAKTEPAKKASAKKASAKKASAKKATPKKKSRLATKGRTEDLTPDPEAAPKKVAPEEADDYVVIEDDDE
ncbi:MAG TPA: hypothetical protein VM513_07610 [Kofleriaceae bacterium]|nr:hypothetical protein [Kofleriaceae bacterium]